MCVKLLKYFCILDDCIKLFFFHKYFILQCHNIKTYSFTSMTR